MRKPANSDSYLLNAEPDPQSQWRSTFLLRMTGYVLLILSVLDIVSLLIPPQFLDPTWHFETIGRLVSRAPVPLIGFVLIFYGGMRYRQRLEKLLLRPLAILGLVFGLVMLLLAPLAIMDGLRVHHENRLNYAEQVAQQEQTFAAYRTRFEQTSGANVAALARSLNLNVPITLEQDGDALKEDVLGQLSNLQATALKQAQTSRRQKKWTVIKNIVKWAAGAILSGFCLLYLGRGAMRLLRLAK